MCDGREDCEERRKTTTPTTTTPPPPHICVVCRRFAPPSKERESARASNVSLAAAAAKTTPCCFVIPTYARACGRKVTLTQAHYVRSGWVMSRFSPRHPQLITSFLSRNATLWTPTVFLLLLGLPHKHLMVRGVKREVNVSSQSYK